MLPYIERELARGTRLSSITRHMLGLFRGVPGARAFRRMLATEAVKPGAGVEVLAEALAQVVDSAPIWRTSPPRPRHRAGLWSSSDRRHFHRRACSSSPRSSSRAVSSPAFSPGLFGIGGGAIIVPVLYEVFRVLDVPEEVRMQLCVGTSMAIIVPTNVRSYLVHRRYGAVLTDVVRAWAHSVRGRRWRRRADCRASRPARCSRSRSSSSPAPSD